MIDAMQVHPDVTLAWCNQKVWEELPDGYWHNTGTLVNPPEGSQLRLIRFGDARQVMGAMHANGAMMLRSRDDETYETPPDLPFSGMEAFRERMLGHPLLYVPQPLAVYARTLGTARTDTRI